MRLFQLCTVPLTASGFGAALVQDWVEDFEKVRPFVRRDPRREADVRAVLDELAAHSYRRKEVAQVLADACEELDAPEAALQNAKSFAQPNVYAVLVTQPPGLFGGPLYTTFKTLTAIKLARLWSERFGPACRFVPVLWVAGDDHHGTDFSHATFVDEQAEVRRIGLKEDPEQRGFPAADTSAAAQARGLLEELSALLPDAAEWVAPYSRRSVSGAFASLMARWFGHLGLVTVDSSEMRRFGGKLFARELQEYEFTSALVRLAGQKLNAAGYEPGITEPRDAPFLYVQSHKVRAALVPVEEGRAFQESSPALVDHGVGLSFYAREALVSRAESAPERFSPAIALRPVLQCQALPVAATVLGSSEMAVWPQVAGLHEHYGVVWPVLVPRFSGTLLDPFALRALMGFNAPPEDLFLPFEQLVEKHLTGNSVSAQISRDCEAILATLAAMHGRVRAVDPNLDALFRKTRANVGHELGRLLERALQALSQREGAGIVRLEYLAHFARPKGHPQERVICTAQFLSQDPGFPDRLLEQMDPLDFSHRVLALADEESPEAVQLAAAEAAQREAAESADLEAGEAAMHADEMLAPGAEATEAGGGAAQAEAGAAASGADAPPDATPPEPKRVPAPPEPGEAGPGSSGARPSQGAGG